MAYNFKIYKKLLAHTTFLSLISGVALSSAANTQTSLHNISPLSSSSSWSNGPFASGDNILFGGNHQIVLDQAGYLVNYVDTNGYSSSKISVQSQTALGSVSNITNTGNSLGLTTVEFVNDVELFLVANDYNYGDYYAITSIAPSNSLGSGKGTVNFGVTVTGSQDIPFDLGTPNLRLDKVGIVSTSSTNAPTITDYQSATVVLKSGHKIYANEFQLSPVTVWGNDFTNVGANNTLELEDGTILDAKVTTRKQSPSLVGTQPPWYDWLDDEAGTLIVDGGATIMQDVGTYNDPIGYVFLTVLALTKKFYYQVIYMRLVIY